MVILPHEIGRPQMADNGSPSFILERLDIVGNSKSVSMRNATITLRPANINDSSACMPLFVSLYHGDIGPDFRQVFTDFVSNKSCIVLLAERAGNVIGILVGSYHMDIDWEGKIAKIDAIVVDATFRKSGVGKDLVHHFVGHARNEKCRAIASRVNRQNKAAQAFHRKLGFAKADTREYMLDLQEQHDH